MMKGNEKAATGNIKGFGASASVEKGTDPMPRPRGRMDSSPMKMEIKDFSRTSQVISGN